MGRKLNKTGEVDGKKLGKRCLLPLIAAATFFVFLGLVAEPGYAEHSGVTPNMPCMDCDGGGGSPPPSNTIEGYVWNRATGQRAGPGITVYLYISGANLDTTTDANGYFKFQSSYIYPNWGYTVTLNGIADFLGQFTDDMHWGQWKGTIQTNGNAYGFRNIYLEPSAIVKVPAAALYSNTKYASMRYGVTQTSAFSHTLSFQVATVGITTGYSSGTTASYTFGGDPSLQWYVNKKHYAATYWNDLLGKVSASGISGFEIQWDWSALLTQEYINPNSLSLGNYKDFDLDPGLFKEAKYEETGSYTWSASLGVPFAIVYNGYGVIISLETTVTATSGTSNWVYYIVDRRGDTNPNTLTFRVYTSGAFYDESNERGGMELHIWDMSGAG